MKKAFLIIIAVFSIFTCASCGKSDKVKEDHRIRIVDSYLVKDNTIGKCRVIIFEDTKENVMYLFTSNYYYGGGLTPMQDKDNNILTVEDYNR